MRPRRCWCSSPAAAAAGPCCRALGCQEHQHRDQHDRRQGDQDDARLASVAVLLAGLGARVDLALGLHPRVVVPRVELVDEEMAVQAQEIGVRPQEPLGVRGAGENREVLLLQRPDVPGADLRTLLDLGVRELLALARLTECRTDFKHDNKWPLGGSGRF